MEYEDKNESKMTHINKSTSANLLINFYLLL